MKTALKSLIATALLTVLYPLNASSFSDKHCELARQLLKETEAEQSHMTGLKEALELQVQSIPQMHSFKGVISKWQDTYLTWDVFEERYVEIICEAYTEPEIASLIEFYQTPIGIKQLEKSDKIVLEVMRHSERVAARHQPELNIMINKRAKELELEVENLFPEFKSEEEPDEIEIHSATNFAGNGMQELVYTLSKTELKEKAAFDIKNNDLPLSPFEAMQIAFAEHYSDIGIEENEYWSDTSATLSSVSLESDDLDSPDTKTLWFYSINCSVFGSYPTFGTPAEIVVLLDKTIIKPKKKT